ncbi:hypothetical protein NIES3787_21690 [Microcystis aeruginosa NIES-3787]|uniref:Transposase n=1 Tax=Microcystis aeruginosa NIES-3787 TaxID=2517782 RepID=A0A6H9GJ85_MICAE|nr:hypothetical protein NIES3787_21690 [Microcystis aeruginosa NIES-3787]
MRVISRRILRDFCMTNANSCESLYDWYRVASKAAWQNLIDVQATYIALFTLLTYRQVLPTKGLSPLPMPHSDENCYISF